MCLKMNLAFFNPFFLPSFPVILLSEANRLILQTIDRFHHVFNTIFQAIPQPTYD